MSEPSKLERDVQDLHMAIDVALALFERIRDEHGEQPGWDMVESSLEKAHAWAEMPLEDIPEDEMSDRQRVATAFHELEVNGISARMDFACCGSCGHAELGEVNNQYVFWHAQEEDRAWDGDTLAETLHVQFSDPETAADAVTTLNEHGLWAGWTGDEGRCIEVFPESKRPAEGEGEEEG